MIQATPINFERTPETSMITGVQIGGTGPWFRPSFKEERKCETGSNFSMTTPPLINNFQDFAKSLMVQIKILGDKIEDLTCELNDQGGHRCNSPPSNEPIVDALESLKRAVRGEDSPEPEVKGSVYNNPIPPAINLNLFEKPLSLEKRLSDVEDSILKLKSLEYLTEFDFKRWDELDCEHYVKLNKQGEQLDKVIKDQATVEDKVKNKLFGFYQEQQLLSKLTVMALEQVQTNKKQFEVFEAKVRSFMSCSDLKDEMNKQGIKRTDLEGEMRKLNKIANEESSDSEDDFIPPDKSRETWKTIKGKSRPKKRR